MDSASQSAPRILGRYALYGAIAAGGMATVHLGRLLGHVGFERTVAIKRLHPQFAQDPEFVSMFLDEARVVARIRHPNVVPTLDVVAEGGELFIVMEYVQGESLARLIKAAGSAGAPIPLPLVAHILGGVLHGLHAAHEARNERGEPLDVVHRDISPQNILVGADGTARILDFGVAKAAGRIQSTREGQLKGKLAYMAPEQISGIVTRTTDVYAASVVLWEALTGRRLFSGENEAHVMKQVLEGHIGPPSEYAPEVTSGLDALVLRGLQREPADRFPTAREMALALEEEVTPVAASKVGAWVEATAHRTLQDRSERIAVIESTSSIHGPVAAPARPVSQAPPPRQVFTRVVEDVHTELSSGSASAPGRPSKAAPRRARTRVPWIVGAVGAIALALVVGVTVRGGKPAASTVPAAAAPPTAVPSPPPALDPAPSPPPPEASLTPVISAMPAAPAPVVTRTTPRRWTAPAPRPSAARHAGVDDGTSDRK